MLFEISVFPASILAVAVLVYVVGRLGYRFRGKITPKEADIGIAPPENDLPKLEDHTD